MNRISFAAAAALMLAATALPGAEPQPTTVRSASPRGTFSTASTWWARFGVPVNEAELEVSTAAVVVGSGGQEIGHPGYVYGPGSCDCTAPCVDWLWDGYYQNPKRCNPKFVHKFCGAGSGGYGNGYGNGCGNGHCGNGHCGNGCGCNNGCGAAAPACGCETGGCCKKCKRFHWNWHKKHHCCLFNRGDDCGCAAPSCEASCAAPTCEALPTCEAGCAAPTVIEPAPVPVPEAPRPPRSAGSPS